MRIFGRWDTTAAVHRLLWLMNLSTTLPPIVQKRFPQMVFCSRTKLSTRRIIQTRKFLTCPYKWRSTCQQIASTHQLSHENDHVAIAGTDMDSSRRSGSSRGSGAISRAVSAHCLATNQSMISIAQRGKLHDSKSRKLAFTEFHNSAQFRKDSVSVFLGDDTSIHYIALSDPMLTDTNVRSTMPSTITRVSKAKGAESKPLTSASSSTDEIYALHPIHLRKDPSSMPVAIQLIPRS